MAKGKQTREKTESILGKLAGRGKQKAPYPPPGKMAAMVEGKVMEVKDKKKKAGKSPMPIKGKMTEKRLAALRDKNGFIEFLVTYPFSFFLETESVTDAIHGDASRMACPTEDYEFYADVYRAYSCNVQKNTVTVLVKGKVQAVPPRSHPVFKADGTETMRHERYDDPPVIGVEGLSSAPPAVAENVAATDVPEEEAAPRATKLKVSATICSDDNKCDAKFDATMWFQNATDSEILALAKCGWGGDTASDKVAEFMRTHDANVDKVIRHAASFPDGHEFQGYEVDVEAYSAKEWIIAHKPHLIDEIGDIDDANNITPEVPDTADIPASA